MHNVSHITNDNTKTQTHLAINIFTILTVWYLTSTRWKRKIKVTKYSFFIFLFSFFFLFFFLGRINNFVNHPASQKGEFSIKHSDHKCIQCKLMKNWIYKNFTFVLYPYIPNENNLPHLPLFFLACCFYSVFNFFF